MLPYPSREKTEKSLNEFGQKFSAAVFSNTFSGHGHDISAVESTVGAHDSKVPLSAPSLIAVNGDLTFLLSISV